MNAGTIDWLAEWKERYPKEIYSWDAKHPDIDREYVTFYPCDNQYFIGDEILTEKEEIKKDIHLYIHIPFCKYLCPFCFFNKYLVEANKSKEYIETLKREIHHYSKKPYLQSCRVISIYFGGGTPTTLSPSQILEILQYIKECFDVSENAEITIESTPLDINEEVAQKLVMGGINRISIGVQSFNDVFLQRLYLHHKGEYCKKVITAIKDLGIKVGIDLMYRLPSQTLSDWQRDLSIALNLNVDTISCYSLELPPPAKEKVFSNVPLPRLDEDIKMYYFVIDYLKDNGYQQYTIADFCLPGRESSYVMNCWKAPQQEYLAFGAGAHSFIGGCVFYNIASLKYYFEWIKKRQLPILFGKKVTMEERMSRYFVLGVKAISVDLKKFEKKFDSRAKETYGDIMAELKERELIRLRKTSMELTRKGMVYVDNISKKFYTINNKGKPQPVGILLQNMKPADFKLKGGISKND